MFFVPRCWKQDCLPISQYTKRLEYQIKTTSMYPGDYLNENSEAIYLSCLRFELACVPISAVIFHVKAIGFY